MAVGAVEAGTKIRLQTDAVWMNAIEDKGDRVVCEWRHPKTLKREEDTFYKTSLTTERVDIFKMVDG